MSDKLHDYINHNTKMSEKLPDEINHNTKMSEKLPDEINHNTKMSEKLPEEMTDEEWIKWESCLPMSERWKIGLKGYDPNKPPPKRTTINEEDLLCLLQKLTLSEGKWDINLHIEYAHIDKEAFIKYALLYLADIINKKIEYEEACNTRYIEEEDYDE